MSRKTEIQNAYKYLGKEAAWREVFRVLKPGGIFCGCFYIKGENKRTDWFTVTEIV